MTRSSFTRLALLVGVLTALVAPSSAVAATEFKYNFSFYDANNPSAVAASGYYVVTGLNPGLNSRIELRHGGGPSYATQNTGAGSSTVYSSLTTGLVPGDTIEVYQPQAAVTPVETVTTPVIPLSYSVGSSTVTGTAPTDGKLEFEHDYGCAYAESTQTVRRAGGDFSVDLGRPVRPGMYLRTVFYSNQGDAFSSYVFAPGETPCIYAAAHYDYDSSPGAQPPVNPYQLAVSGLSNTVAPDGRIEHLRGGAALFSGTYTGAYWDDAYDQVTLPGDQFNIYRPKEAATPSLSVTVPQVSATFDPSVDLVAVDGPALAGITTYTCSQYTCSQENGRQAGTRPAGRTFLDFTKFQSWDWPVDLKATDRVYVVIVTESGNLRYSFKATPGDLVAPTQKLTLGSKTKLSKLLAVLKKGYKVKLRSSESATATLTLSIGKTKIASGKRKIASGNSSVTLRFTKAGRKALAKYKSKGRKFKGARATLSSQMVDASGNSSTLKAKTKITR